MNIFGKPQTNLQIENSTTNTRMKTKEQFEVTPRAGARRNLATRTAVASLALAATIPVVAGDNSTPGTREDRTAIRPFRVTVAEADLADLRNRIKATKWPERETVSDASQGVQLGTMQKISRYWATDYDWRKV